MATCSCREVQKRTVLWEGVRGESLTPSTPPAPTRTSGSPTGTTAAGEVRSAVAIVTFLSILASRFFQFIVSELLVSPLYQLSNSSSIISKFEIKSQLCCSGFYTH